VVIDTTTTGDKILASALDLSTIFFHMYLKPILRTQTEASPIIQTTQP